jgi:Zn-finger nucleic acid-binding protein
MSVAAEGPPCPRCINSRMLPQVWNGVPVSICMSCGANFFRHGDLAAWEGWSKDVPEAADRSAQHKAATVLCPGCSSRMERLRFPLTPPLDIERCPGCEGILLDFEEIRRVPEVGRLAAAKRGGGGRRA